MDRIYSVCRSFGVLRSARRAEIYSAGVIMDEKERELWLVNSQHRQAEIPYVVGGAVLLPISNSRLIKVLRQWRMHSLLGHEYMHSLHPKIKNIIKFLSDDKALPLHRISIGKGHVCGMPQGDDGCFYIPNNHEMLIKTHRILVSKTCYNMDDYSGEIVVPIVIQLSSSKHGPDDGDGPMVKRFVLGVCYTSDENARQQRIGVGGISAQTLGDILDTSHTRGLASKLDAAGYAFHINRSVYVGNIEDFIGIADGWASKIAEDNYRHDEHYHAGLSIAERLDAGMYFIKELSVCIKRSGADNPLAKELTRNLLATRDELAVGLTQIWDFDEALMQSFYTGLASYDTQYGSNIDPKVWNFEALKWLVDFGD